MNEDCLKLTIYFGERDRAGDAFLSDALLDLFGRERAAARYRGLRRKAATADPAAAHTVRGPAARGGGRGRAGEDRVAPAGGGRDHRRRARDARAGAAAERGACVRAATQRAGEAD